MAKYFGVILFAVLVSVTLANSKQIVCQREPGDRLLSSQPILQVSIFNKPRISKRFDGHRITCVEANLPLGLEKVLALSILEGGVGCDFVGLQISVGKLLTVGVGLKIYGLEETVNTLDDLSCRSPGFPKGIAGDGGLLGILQL